MTKQIQTYPKQELNSLFLNLNTNALHVTNCSIVRHMEYEMTKSKFRVYLKLDVLDFSAISHTLISWAISKHL